MLILENGFVRLPALAHTEAWYMVFPGHHSHIPQLSCALTWWVITDIKQQGKDYLYSVTVTSVSPIMRLILSTVLVLALSSVTLGIFFNTPVSLDYQSVKMEILF